MATKQSTPLATENPFDTSESDEPLPPIINPGLEIPELSEENYYFNYYRELYQSASEGNLKDTEGFLKYVPHALTTEITRIGMTALHVAAFYGRTEMVKWLVERMPVDAPSKQTHEGYTALHYAVISGDLEMVRILIRKNSGLTQIPCFSGYTPLLYAVMFFPNRKLVAYLVKKTTDDPLPPFSDPHQAGQQTCNLTTVGFHDIVLSLLSDYQNLPWAESSDGRTVLGVLANEPQHFESGTTLKLWQKLIYQFPLCGAENPLENPEDFAKTEC